MTSLISQKMPPSVISDALKAFIQGEYEKFDGLVGDTACHMRAAKICDLAEQPSTEPWSDFDCAFLVNSYFLNGTKRLMPQGHTFQESTDDALGMKQFGISSKNKTSEIRTHAQKVLSQSSVEYVQAQAKPALLPFVSGSFELQDDRGRSLIPCYFSMKILLKKPRYILLKCKQVGKEVSDEAKILYAPRFQRRSPYIPIPISPDMAKIPAMVIEGYCFASAGTGGTSLEDRIKRIPLKTILLANAAQHAQYAGGYKYQSIPFPPNEEKQQRKFIAMQQAAEELGCSQTNPTLFCVDHVFCSRIGAP